MSSVFFRVRRWLGKRAALLDKPFMRLISIFWALTGLLLAAVPVRAEPPVIFAASSLRGALDQAVSQWPEVPRISYGASGTLTQQIARGAPADLVILASGDWMSWLEGRITFTAQRDVLSNRLVLIARDGRPLEDLSVAALEARLNGGRLVIGQHRAVPAGAYARAWLEGIGAWEALAPQLAEAANVRAALAFVAQGAAPLGVVYATDAQAEPRVTVIYDIPTTAHPRIRYPAAALTARGATLLEAIANDQGAFAAAGFEVLP